MHNLPLNSSNALIAKLSVSSYFYLVVFHTFQNKKKGIRKFFSTYKQKGK